MNKTLVLMFGLALVFFVCTMFINNPIINIVFMVIAIMAANGAATMLWSVYCPSLRDTGFTSGATGFLDFINYAAAGVFTLIIGAVVGHIGWLGILIGLTTLMAFGLVLSLYVKKEKTQEVN
jgi:predicted MFS family arabinose efflux permease